MMPWCFTTVDIWKEKKRETSGKNDEKVIWTLNRLEMLRISDNFFFLIIHSFIITFNSEKKKQTRSIIIDCDKLNNFFFCLFRWESKGLAKKKFSFNNNYITYMIYELDNRHILYIGESVYQLYIMLLWCLMILLVWLILDSIWLITIDWTRLASKSSICFFLLFVDLIVWSQFRSYIYIDWW